MSALIPANLLSFKSLEDLGPGVDVEHIFPIEELYPYTIDNSTTEHEQRSGIFHPSSVGYCKRANYYQYVRAEITDTRSKGFHEIVTLGHRIHDIVQGRLEHIERIVEHGRAHSPGKYRDAVVKFQREVTFDPETDTLYLDLNIGGTCDGLLWIKTRDWEQYGVIEIKSQNDEWFVRAKSQKTAFKNHLMQSHLYAFRFNAPIIWVWYYNKNNSKREIKPHFFDPEIFNEAIQYFADLNDFVTAGVIPPREDSYFECSECMYRTLCDPPALRSKKSKSLPVLPAQEFRRRIK